MGTHLYDILKVLVNPPLYNRLIDEFNGKILPPEKGLANHLKNVYRQNQNSAMKAAKVFMENLRFVGVIDSNNRLRYLQPSENLREENKESVKEEISIPVTVREEKSSYSQYDDSLFELPIPLPNKRKAYLKYPLADLTRKDILVIKKALEFIESSIEDDVPIVRL